MEEQNPDESKPTITNVAAGDPVSSQQFLENVLKEPSQDADQIRNEHDAFLANTDILNSDLHASFAEPSVSNVLDGQSNIDALLEENASYERINFNLTTELSAIKDQLIQLSSQNEQLQQQITCNSTEMTERSKLFRQMEVARNELSFKCTTLEAEIMKIRNEKEERDTAIKALTRDKHAVFSENVQLKDELKNLSNEKSNLQLHLHNIEQEKRNMAFERERAQTDKALFEESKKWFMKEISEKDNAMSKLRMEISALEMKWQNERMDFGRQVKELRIKTSDLEEMLALKEDSLKKNIESIETREADHRREVESIEKELRASKELTSLYKDSMEKAEQCAAEFREALKAKESLAHSTKVLIEELRQEIEEEKSSFMSQLEQKDGRIHDLEDEIQKANEMLKNKHAVTLNLTEDELANLSPAAAETSKFVKGGMTLTGMMREQARLAGELAAERERCQQLEAAMKEIVEDIEANAPHLLHQKQQIDKLFDENSKLKEQLDVADQNRYRLESSRDSAIRELAFTRAELEKFQRDLMDLTKKHQHLLFVLEKERMIRDTDSPPPSADDDRLLYDSIVQLQKKNMQLESELASEKASAGQVAIAAQNLEMEKLKKELDAYVSSNSRLSAQLNEMQTAFDTLQEQSKHLSALVEDNVSAAEARAARQKAEDAIAELRASEMKIARLEESVNYMKEEKSVVGKSYEEKINAYQSTINELTQTRAKLEAEFEQQKQIALTCAKELELMEKEVARVKKEYDQMVSLDKDNNNKLSEMSTRLIEMQDNCSSFKIKCAVLEGEQKQSTSTIGRLEAQIDLFKSTSFSDQQMMSSLSELSTRLSRMEAEKQGRLGSQIEILQMENETLKTAAARANNQLTHAKNEAKVLQFKQVQQIALLDTQLKEKEEQLRVSEQQLSELKAKLAVVQSQYSGDDNTEDMSPERLKKECQQLKNRVQYLESQCEELKNKLASAEVEVARKEDEMNKLTTHSGKMETGLVEAQRLGEMERNRLECRAQGAENRAEELSKTVGELRGAIDQKDSEIMELKMSHLQATSELQQRVEVQLKQISDAENEITISKTTLENMRADLENKATECDSMREEINLVNQQLSDTQEKIAVAESRLQTQQDKVFQAQEAARIAEECRMTAEQNLAHLTAKAADDEVKWREVMDQNAVKISDLLKQYEELVAKFGPTDSSLDSSTLNPDLPQSVISSQQGVIQFLRDEKDSAINRAMKSEVEVLRLRAEVKEVLAGRDELISKIKKLEIDAAVAGEELAEKAELLKRVEELMSYQQQTIKLRSEKESLEQLHNSTSARVKELEELIEKNKTVHAQIQQSLTEKTAEASKLQKEVEILKERVSTSRPEKQHELIAQIEQLRAKQSALEEENKRLVSHEKLQEGFKQKFDQARSLAIRYRDQLNVLKSQNPNLELPEAAKAEKEKLQQKIVALTKQIADFNTEKQNLLTDIESKNSEIQEGKIRLQLLTNQISKKDTEIASLHKDIQVKTETVKSLESHLSNQTGGQGLSVTNTSSQSAPVVPATTSGARVAAAPLFSQANTSVEAPLACSSPLKTSVNVSQETAQVSTLAKGATSTFGGFGGQRTVLFGKSAPPAPALGSSTISSNSTHGTVDVTLCDIDTTIAGQSNQVSGSINLGDDTIDEVLNGESRDSGMNAPVSSTDAGRKRPAPSFAMEAEAKRQRESPNETVTSSEEPVVQETGTDAQEEEHGSSQDIIAYQPEEGNYVSLDNQDDAGDNDVLSVEDDEENDESIDDEEYDDDIEALEDQDGEVQVISDDENVEEVEESGDEEDLGADVGDDEDDDVLEVQGDDNSRSQASLDQDREAASAMEEADDEGRESADSGAVHTEVSASHPQNAAPSNVEARPTRTPIVFNIEADDQCSSSNETGSVPPAPAQRGGRGVRGGRRGGVALYQPRVRGNKRGSK